VSRDVAKPDQLSPFDCGEEWFLRTYIGAHCVFDIFIGLVLLVGYAQKSPQASHFKRLDALFSLCHQGPCFTSIQQDGYDQ